MPKPIPPPPPQPSVEETVRAVRFVRVVAVAAAAFFLAVASTYGPDNFFAQYGRGGAPSWNLKKLDDLDEAALRAHPGGKVAWLVGSSILREGFDAPAVNAALAERGGEYRVAKFGIARGAAGVVAGFVEQLPLREGDVVVHNITNAHFHAGWIPWTGLPPDVMMHTVPRSEFWSIPGWTLADQLEQAAAEPFEFWRWHDDVMRGLTKWIEAVWWWDVPEVVTETYHLTHRDWVSKHDYMARMREVGIETSMYLRPESCDYSDQQFNIRGIERLESVAAASGATLELIIIPARQEYDAVLVHRDAATQFDAWTSGVDNLSFAPRPFEDGFYDYKHPNYRGRELLGGWLADWLTGGQPRGTAPPLRWPIPETNRHGVTPPPQAGLGSSSTGDDTEDE